MAKVMRKEALAYTKADRASGNPLFPSIYPQNQSLPTLLFHALTYTSDFTGGWPPLPLSKKALTYSSKSIKIPRHDKSVSTYELLWRLSSLPVQVYMRLFTASQPWEARDVLDLLKADSFGKLEIISIVGWLGIILVKGFSFVVPIITANSLPWVWQACLRSNLSAD